ncbi:hypothetical protein AKJ09_11266 [Labilithrix luteola]|uniref:Uncharacterized protein n=1 Tax=Labilithrix luteola TaxID=1391654 RepID=A0A0K1QFV2_9BACT|nr:hypothetical protein [Labilithrix luteola]AKV04603.1 hypothetical protein AKJ09_11266 [Labilithrix luteola]
MRDVRTHAAEKVAGRRIVAVALSLFAFARGSAPDLAFAQDVAPSDALLDLTWTAPADCPQHDEVVARVDAIVGPRRAGQHSLRARAELSASKVVPRYRLRLLVGAETSPRTLADDDCSRLADAAALVLALDIDPEALTREHAAAPGPVEPTAPPVSTPVPPPAPPPPQKKARRARSKPPPQERAIGVTLGGRFVFDSGSLPRPTMGLGLAVDLRRGPWALELQGTAFHERFTVGGPHGGVGGAYVRLATGSLFGCFDGRARWVDVGGCVGGELGRQATEGVSISQPGESAGVWSAVGTMLRVRGWPRLPISPSAGVLVGFPLSASSITIERVGTVFEAPGAFVRVFLGLEGKIL